MIVNGELQWRPRPENGRSPPPHKSVKAVGFLASLTCFAVNSISPIFSSPRPPSHFQYFHAHPHSIPDRMHLGTIVMAPPHRYFGNFQTLFTRQENKLHVKGPAMDLLQGKNGLRSLAGEGLETALGIVEIQSHHGFEKKIEGPRINPPQQRLPLKLKRRIEPARADSDIGPAFERGKELVGLYNRRREVGVGKQQELAPGVEHPVADRKAFALVSRVANELDFRILGGKTSNNLRGVISGAVVDHQQLSAPLVLAQMLNDTLQRAADPPALVIGGNDDAVSWLCQTEIGTIPREVPDCHTHAACSSFLSILKNSATSSGSHRPAAASCLIVCSVSSWGTGGL